jgi:hypothetical protein
MIESEEDLLVVGPELPGHSFILGDNLLRGRTCPWNTFAIWRVDYLGLTGFPMIGDGVSGDRSIGGVEVTFFFFPPKF